MKTGGSISEESSYNCTGTHADSNVGRRACLKLLGVGTALLTGVATGSDVGRAASGGYGEGEIGAGPYGGDGVFAVTTWDATDVEEMSAMLVGELSDLDGADSADCYFEWRRTGENVWTMTTKQTVTSAGSFTASLTGLGEGVDYEYRAVATASDSQTSTGSVVAFTTTGDAPIVTTRAPSAVTDSRATLSGNLTDLGGATSVDCGFEWRSLGASSWNRTATRILSAAESFSVDIGGLSSETDYEFRAIGIPLDGDTAVGTTASFITDVETVLPTIDSYTVTEAGSPNPHCTITADWSVSDADGDLEKVGIRVLDATGSVVIGSATSVNGGHAEGVDTFNLKHADGQTFEVAVTVTDAAGNSDGRSQWVTE